MRHCCLLAAGFLLAAGPQTAQATDPPPAHKGLDAASLLPLLGGGSVDALAGSLLTHAAPRKRFARCSWPRCAGRRRRMR